MSPGAILHPHRAHDSAIVLLVGVLVAGCGGSVPRPSYVQVSAEDYVAVPFRPRPPPVEVVPPRPEGQADLVWADGGWEWSGDRYRWTPGAWVVPSPGAKLARWVIVRRAIDGQLFFAPSRWRDAGGKPLAAPTASTPADTRAGGRVGARVDRIDRVDGGAGGPDGAAGDGGAGGSPAGASRTDLDE